MKLKSFDHEHAQQLRFVREAGFIPGSQYGFYSVTAVDDGANETESLWLFELSGGSARRICHAFDNASVPSPSPNGRLIAFCSDRGGIAQVHLADVTDGETRQLTTLPQGVASRPVWSPDGRSLAFAAGRWERRDPSRPYRVDRLTYTLHPFGFVDDVAHDLYLVEVDSGAIHQLTSDPCMNSDPRWSPDGRRLCYLVSLRPDRIADFLPELHVIDVESRESHAVVSEWGGVFAAEWCSDGARIAFAGHARSGGYHLAKKMDLWTVGTGGGDHPSCRTSNVISGVGSWIQADLPIYATLAAKRICVREDAAYLSCQIRSDVAICRVSLSGPEMVEIVFGQRDQSAYLLDVGPNDEILYLQTSFTEPPELVLGSRWVTTLNDELLAEVVAPNVAKLDVTAPDGVRTEAWVLTPSGADGPSPGVLYIHGGPYGAFGSTFMIDFHLLVGAGFAVVFGNFRGSGGYGTEFSRKIVGQWGRAGALDHHAALDVAIRAGLVDGGLVGVCGYSYGGFATCWLVGNSDRFKAAVAENPATDHTTTYFAADTPWFVEAELGGTPYHLPERYRADSPLTFAPQCNTPLLFIVGEDDVRCPPLHSEQYYRVLKLKGVPTEMLRLPGSGHLGTWNGPISARIAQNEALVAWFRRYLMPGVSEPARTAPGEDA